MGLKKRGDIWWIRLQRNGRLIQQSTGTSIKKDAQSQHAEVLRDLDKGRYPDTSKNTLKPIDRTFEELKEKYLAEHALPNKSKESFERDGYSFKQLERVFGGLKLSDITSDSIGNYKVKRRNDGVKPPTLAKELQLLRAVLNIALKQWKWITTTPFNDVTIENPDTKDERWLNEEEEKRLLAACPVWLREIILVAVNTGMRRSELLSLKWFQVDLDRKTLVLYKTKNREVRGIPLNDIAHGILKAKSAGKDNDGYVFPSKVGTKRNNRNLNRAFETAREKVGLDDVSPHNLRHTAASRMSQEQVDIVVISKILGHKDLRSTMRYAHHNVESVRHGVDALVKGVKETSGTISVQ